MNMLIGRTFAQTFQLLESVKQNNSLVLFSDSGETAYARISQLCPGWEFNPTLCGQSVKASATATLAFGSGLPLCT